jgi:hypothetical protein
MNSFSGTKNSYMIDIDLPVYADNDFLSLLPYQRVYIDKLIRQRVILHYSVSYDRRKLWVVIQADNISDVKKMIGSFPIFNYIRFKIHNLLFNETNTIAVPQMCLN